MIKASASTNFAGLLLLLFIGLKLTDCISWPWLWVLSPLWIPIAGAGLVVVVGLTFMGVRKLWKTVT